VSGNYTPRNGWIIWHVAGTDVRLSPADGRRILATREAQSAALATAIREAQQQAAEQAQLQPIGGK
jgi:hypothetical protein